MKKNNGNFREFCMDKIKHYRRIYRICPKMYKKMLRNVPKNLIGSIADPPKRKKCLSEDEVKNLLRGHVTIDEKIDGGVLGLAWSGEIPLAVGKHGMVNYDNNSKKFHGLGRWIYSNYEKISKIPMMYIVYGEWMDAQHNIPYDGLPDYFLGFDIWNGHKFLDIIERSIFLYDIGFAEVPFIYSGTDLGIDDLICITEGVGGVSNKSRFSSNEIFEGLIVRNDNGLVGKYVRREFLESIEEDWSKLPLIENKLRVYKKEL
jgi:hypothetical protein